MRHAFTYSKGRLIGGYLRSAHRLATAFVLSALAAGCDSLLEVDLPGRVAAEALDNPELAPTLVNGIVTDFECAYVTYVGSTAVFSDELEHVGFNRLFNQIDARGASDIDDSGDCGQAGTSYRPLQIARFQAEDVYGRISGWGAEGVAIPNGEALLAKTAAYAGYTYTLLGEGWCDGAVPITDRGPPVSRTELFTVAEQRFTTAIDHARAAGLTDILHLATLGRARARLDRGDLAGALADAQAIPDGFVFYATRDQAETRRENIVASWNVLGRVLGVEPAFRGLTVNGVPDPRVMVVDSNRLGDDGQNFVWEQMKYRELADDARLASWDEAQLIIAEVLGGGAAVAAINRLRDKADLPHYAGGSEAEIQAQVIEERRRELFLEAHRMNDVYRHGLEYLQGPVTTKTTPFGGLKCFAPQRLEMENNPNF